MARLNQLTLQRGAGEFMSNLFALRVYGEKLLTPRVRKEQAIFASLLTLMFFVDTWAWSRAWAYGLGGFFLPVAFGLVLGLATVLFDRSVIVADTTTGKSAWWTIAGRAAFLVVISFLTAVPVELAVFEPEIDKRIGNTEKVAIDKIRDKALEVERKRFDARIAEKQVELAAHASATTAVASGDVDTFRADREEERQKIITAQADKRKSLTDSLTAKSEQVALEAAGKGPSGKYGNGPAFQAMQAQEAQLRQDLVDFEAQAAKQMEAFELATVTKTADLRAKRDQHDKAGKGTLIGTLDDLRKQKDQKREEVMLMEPAKLAALYGDSWVEAKGFLARYYVLSELAAEKPTVAYMVWGCRLVMILLGLCILGLKLMASQEFKLYYSLAAQAKAGDTDAQAAVSNMGYDDYENYGLSDRARDLLQELYEAQQRVWWTTRLLERKLQELCQPNAVTGVHQNRVAIEGQLHAYWIESADEDLREVHSLEKKLKLTGLGEQLWPVEFGDDPRKEPEVWKVDDHRLESFGWVNPDDIVDAGNQARDVVIEKQRALRRLLSKADRDLIAAVLADSRVLKRQLEAVRREFYDVEVVPVLEDLEMAEHAMTKAGLTLPPWPKDFVDPRKDLFRDLCVLDERVLQDQYGWRGRSRSGGSSTPPAAPAATASAAAVTSMSDDTNSTILPEPKVTPETVVPTSISDTEEPAEPMEEQKAPTPSGEPAEAVSEDISHMAEQLDPRSIGDIVDKDKKKTDASQGISFDKDAWHNSALPGTEQS